MTTTNYTLKQPIPVLETTNIKASLDFFCNNFGFEEPWEHQGFYGGVHKDGQQIHFTKKDAPNSSMVYNFVEGVDAIYEKVQAAGVEIVSPISDQPYGMRDFLVKDNAGNQIGFSQTIEG
jgi:uncharacterized glyoxalase superfamily protein PhnB